MKKFENDLMTMNLQFFAEDGESAEGTGEKEAEVAEQPESAAEEAETENEGVNEEVAEPQVQSAETNAAFANMRRQLEAANRRQQQIDAMYAQRFGNYTNPETGQPIRSAADYAAAMEAQQRLQTRQQLKDANIDPGIIDQMIENSPAIRQAKAATAELNSIRANQMMEEDFKTVLALDPTKQSQEDIINDESYAAVVDMVARTPGLRFSDAYKLVNFDRLSNSKGAAAKQAAINQIKGKNHLSTGASLNVGDTGEDIPANVVEMYKESFPGKTMAELKALYNKAIGARS